MILKLCLTSHARCRTFVSMNKLTHAKRALVLNLLSEGNSLRATSRLADVSLNTVYKLAADPGAACAAYHDQHVRGLKAEGVKCDESWAFLYSKQKNVAIAKSQDLALGDAL